MSHLIRNEDLVELHQCVDNAMSRLSAIWNNIGIVGDQRLARRRVVQMHLGNLLDEMVREEDQLRTRLLNNVDKYRTDVTRLCVELNLKAYEPSEGLTVLQLEKDLRSQLDTLSTQKQNRLRQLKQRSKVDQQLCDNLGMTPYYVASNSVPTEQQLSELDKHIQELEVEQAKRQKVMVTTRQNIMRLLDELELSPNTSFEREVVCDVDTVSLTTANLQAVKRYSDELEQLHGENSNVVADLWAQLKSLWDRCEISSEDRDRFQAEHAGISQRTIHLLQEEIGRCEILKLNNIQHVIESTRKELCDWWDKCCVAAEERVAFTPLQEEEMTEDLLILHEQEVKRLREYYRQHRELLDRVAHRQQLWTQFLDLEQKANNPDRFLNRGCSLLKEEKARKKLAVELPKVDQEVSKHIKFWEETSGEQFLVYGLQFDEYIKQLYDEFDAEKENEKVLRQQQKARQMEEEILYGSKPAVPAGTKRFAGNTPTKTPNKLRKVTDTPKSGQKSKYNGTNFYSPVCLPPRSASREKLHTAVVGNAKSECRRTPFAEHTQNTAATPSTTIVAASSSTCTATSSDMDTSRFIVGPYDEFASGLNLPTKPNCRSTLVPKAAFF